MPERVSSAKTTRPGVLGQVAILVAVFLALAGLFAALGYAAYSRLAEDARRQAHQQLAAVADLKVRQVVAWLDERRGDALVAMNSPYAARLFDEGERAGWPPGHPAAEILVPWMRSRADAYGYSNVLLLDANARPRLSLDAQYALHDEVLAVVHEALRTGSPQISDLHRWEHGHGTATVGLHVVAPIFVNEPAGRRPVGAIVFDIDPAKHLFPLIQSWPTPSPSAETFLVRREGAEMVYLNELRHLPGAALELRVPISTERLAGAMMLREGRRIVEGVDYRGVPVLAAGARIAGTDWLMASKIDRDEVYATLDRLAFVAALMTLVLVAGSGALLLTWWRRSAAVLEAARYRAELEQRVLHKRLDDFTRHANDIIVLVDGEDRIVDVNNRAVEAYARSRDELLKMRSHDLRAPKALPEFEDEIERAIAQDGAIYETAHQRADGTVFPVEISTRAIELDGQHFRQGIIRDISDRKAAEMRQRRLNRALSTLSACNRALVHATDERGLLDEVCRLIVAVGGYRFAWIGFAEQDAAKSVLPVAFAGFEDGYLASLRVSWDADAERGRGPMGEVIRSGKTVLCGDVATDPGFAPWRDDALRRGYRSLAVIPILRDAQAIGGLSVSAAEVDAFDEQELALLDELAGDLGYGLRALGDAAKRARAEDELRRREIQLRQITDNVPACIAYVDATRTVRFANHRYAEVMGRPLEEIIGRPLQAVVGVETWEFIRERVAQVLAGRRMQYERGYRRADGEILFFDTALVPDKDAAGATLGYYVMMNDVTAHRLAEQALQESAARFRSLTDLSSDFYWETDAEHRMIARTESHGTASALGPGGALGKPRWELPYASPDAAGWQAHRAVLDARQPFRDFEYARPDRNGAIRHYAISGEPVLGADANFRGYRGVGREITERKRAEESLRLNARAVEASSNGILIVDFGQPEQPIVFVNTAFERITGYAASEALGRNARFLMGEDIAQIGVEEIRAALRDGREGRAELRNFRKDRHLFWNHLSVSPVRDTTGRITHYVGVIEDITERKGYEAQLEHQAQHDALTGLPNRALLGDRMHQTIVHADRAKRAVAVLLLDLDGFKLVNDSLGHSFGDALLRVVAERLTAAVREGDTVARLGGDEFVVVLSQLARIEDAASVARKILEAVARPVIVDDHELVSTTSIGISAYPRDGTDAELLLQHADAAMYRAKEQGGGRFEFFTEELNARASAQLALLGGLRRGLEHGEFLLHYQPIVRIGDGSIRKAEALVRWNRDGQSVPPAEFIPLAESSGLIVPLGEWVLRTACAQARAWRDAGLPIESVAVNLSARQFREENLVDMIGAALLEAGLEARHLELEITESAVMHDAEQAVATLQALKAMGIQVAVDDFGTGYSSLGYLKRFPIDAIKIDRSFVKDVTTDEDDTAIVVAIIGLAHALDLKVVAEGVETAAQRSFLEARNCDYAQGYLYGRPVPADEFARLIATGRHGAPTATRDRAVSARRRAPGRRPSRRRRTPRR